jgi:hypothetical protein
MERRIQYIKYTTDILRRKDNKIIEFTEIPENNINDILKIAKKLECPIVARTYPRPGRPNGGKWYLKGHGLHYGYLKELIENAYIENKHPTVDIYLIKL